MKRLGCLSIVAVILSFFLPGTFSVPGICQPPVSPAPTSQSPTDGREHRYQHLFFVDVSGSMNEPGKLRGPGSPTRQYLADHLFVRDNLFHEGEPITVYSFTVKCNKVFSRPLRYAEMQDLMLTGFPVSHENTDLVETLHTAQSEYQQHVNGGTTLAWILTDNVNDPAGNGPDDQNTRSFYGEMFREEARAQRMYFFPMKDSKLVLYLLVFAPDASLEGTDIDAFEEGLARFARELKAPKIRAKPVGGERPLELAGISSADERVMANVIGSGSRGSLKIEGIKEGKPLNVRFRLHIRSRFDEWRVEEAKVEAVGLQDVHSDDFPNLARRMPAYLSPREVTVDPRSQSDKVYTLDLGEDGDEGPRAPFFTLAALNPDAHGVINAKLVVKIGDPKLTLKIFNDPATTADIQSVFRLQDIAYFVPKSAVSNAARLDLVIPVQFDVKYNSLPRWLALGGIFIVVVGGLVLMLVSRGRGLECRLIGYQEESFKLTPAAAFVILDQGARIAELRKSMFGGIQCRPVPGVTVNGKPFAVRLGNGSPVELVRGDKAHSFRLEILRRQRSVPLEPSRTESGGFY
jgi:hypothetical protein